MKFMRSVSRFFAVATLASVGLLAGAGTATAATVVSDGTNASGILGLQVKGVLYDVDFIKIDGTVLYGIDPPIYDFNEEDGFVARNAINDALNLEGGIETVGIAGFPSLQESIFNIGFDKDQQRTLTVQGEWTSTFGWDDGGLGFPTHAVVYADFKAPAEVPIPAAAWLFGSALLGLLGLARRKTV